MVFHFCIQNSPKNTGWTNNGSNLQQEDCVEEPVFEFQQASRELNAWTLSLYLLTTRTNHGRIWEEQDPGREVSCYDLPPEGRQKASRGSHATRRTSVWHAWGRLMLKWNLVTVVIFQLNISDNCRLI
jgi:hypothetical protein